MSRDSTRTVLVCGGRTYRHNELMFQVLDMAHESQPIGLLVTGGAPGADSLAQHWAKKRGIFCATYAADWAQHGRAAGPIRNQAMLDGERPDLVLAFPGGRGTADMVRRARAAGLDVVEV